ncbi:MAG: VanZ family protein [Patescibacteria group bacterium]|nr:VanZ family protein [Patescibacteria group bacterium]
MKEKIKLWLPVIIWAGIIFLFSNQTINKPAPFSWPDFVVKKTAHVTEYAIFYWLLFRAISQKNKLVGKKSFIFSLIIVILFALSDEWHQTFIPGREGTLRDVGFDTIGGLLSLTQIKKQV